MISDQRMARAARTAMTQCLGIRKGETLLIVANPELRRIGDALYAEGARLGARAALMFYPAGEINGEEPPKLIAEAMVRSDVVVAPTVTSITHTTARRNACKAGARVATMPGITEEFFVRGLSANYDELIALTRRVHKVMDRASVARVTSPSGCDITIDIGNHPKASDGDLKKRGSFSNLPTGECALAPRDANGILVADRCANFITEPTRLTIQDGRIVGYQSNTSGRRFKRLIERASKRDGNDNASFIAEFAIGTNKKAKITGVILEDEKVYGTCHIAFGDNTSFSGGRNPSVLHMDVIVFKPNIELDGKTIMKKGKLTF